MSTVLTDARKIAMNLSVEDRFVLAHELFESLDQFDDGISLEEIDRRLAQCSDPSAWLTQQELEQSMQEAIDGSKPPHSKAGTTGN